MSFQNFKSDFFCVGCGHRSATTKIYGDITSKGSKVLNGDCSICKRKKSMTVSVNKEAEGLGNFFKNKSKRGVNVSKKKAKNVIKHFGRAPETGANIVSAFASESPKRFYHLYQKWLISII